MESILFDKQGQWRMGRALGLRVHLGAYLLQQLFNKTDRQTEYDIKDNAAYQIFCGLGMVKKWQVPDHTKIETFRSRLSPETQKKIANHMAAHAVKRGWGDAREMDIDSTVQEANMTYPADSVLLKKLGVISAKVATFLRDKFSEYVTNPIEVNIKKIAHQAREYFFLSKNAAKKIKNEKLRSLLKTVTEEVTSVIEVCKQLDALVLKKIKWNFKRSILQIKEIASQYLEDVRKFLIEGGVVATKRLSFHLKEVACFTKGKLGKKYQFGRAFQLGRIGGNFFFVTSCTSIRMDDKTSLSPIIQEHEKVFNETKIDSIGTDKGYYSKENEKYLVEKEIEVGIQRPANIKKAPLKPLTKEREEALINRRSGIEPLIGHLKQGGQLGRSRMKSDRAIECSGYTSVAGFNMRQIIRYQKKADKAKVA